MGFELVLQDDTGVVIDFLGTVEYDLVESGFTFPPPRRKDVTAGPVFGIHGEKIVTSIYQNRVLKITFDITASSYNTIIQNIMTINDMLDRAKERNSEDDKAKNVELYVQLDSSDSKSYFRVLNGELKLPDYLFSMEGVHFFDGTNYRLTGIVLTLEAEPFAYSSSNLNTWESVTGDRPLEVALQNINSTGYDSGGVEVDNHFDANAQNFVSLEASSVIGDKKNATTLVLTNESATYETMGKLYIGAAPGNYFYTLTANIDDSVTTMYVDQEVYHYATPLVMLIGTEEILITVKENATRKLTIVRGHNSTTPASHTAGDDLELISLNTVLEAEDGDFSDLIGGLVIGASVNAQGTDYSEDDVLTITGGGGTGCTLLVSTVGGSGEVLTFIILTVGSGYSETVGASTTVVPSGGTGCTIDIEDVQDDDHTNSADAGSSGGEYEAITLEQAGVKSVVSWTMTQDQVAAQKGLIRIFGRLANVGTAAGRFWRREINYRLTFSYTGRSALDTVVYTTDWKSPQITTVQLFDFGSVTLPPFAFPGNDNIAGLKITLEVQIKPDDVLDDSLDAITYYMNLDYLYLFPIEYGYRVIETRSEPIARGDKIVDDGWQDLAYVEQIESYPSGDSMGRASILNAYMLAIQLSPNEDQRIYFLQESTSGLAEIDRTVDVQVFTVGTFLNLVY